MQRAESNTTTTASLGRRGALTALVAPLPPGAGAAQMPARRLTDAVGRLPPLPDSDAAIWKYLGIASGAPAPMRRRAMLAVAEEAHRLAALEPDGPATIGALGREIGALWEEHDWLDEQALSAPPGAQHDVLVRRASERHRRIQDRTLKALSDPAESLADCATQAALSAEHVEIIASQFNAGSWQAEVGGAIAAAQLALAIKLADLCVLPLNALGHCDLADHAGRLGIDLRTGRRASGAA